MKAKCIRGYDSRFVKDKIIIINNLLPELDLEFLEKHDGKLRYLGTFSKNAMETTWFKEHFEVIDKTQVFTRISLKPKDEKVIPKPVIPQKRVISLTI